MQYFARYARSAVAAAAVILMVAGCSSVKLDEQAPAPIVDAGAGGAGPTDARGVAPVTAASTAGVDPFTDPNTPLSKKSVFFDFDSFVLKSEFQPLVEAHGSTSLRTGADRSRSKAIPMNAAAASTTSRSARSAPKRSSSA